MVETVCLRLPLHTRCISFHPQVTTCQPSSDDIAVTWTRRPCPTGWWPWISPRWREGRGRSLSHTHTHIDNIAHPFAYFHLVRCRDMVLVSLQWQSSNRQKQRNRRFSSLLCEISYFNAKNTGSISRAVFLVGDPRSADPSFWFVSSFFAANGLKFVEYCWTLKGKCFYSY